MVHAARVIPLSLVLTLLGLGLAALGGCSGPSGGDLGARVPVGQKGLVRVEIARGLGTEVAVAAYFVRHRDVDGTTAATLAGEAPVAPFGCTAPVRPPAMDELLAILPDTARVEHLDAGEITVIFEGVAVSTTPTRLPALHPWVGGVEYDEQAVEVAEPMGAPSVGSAAVLEVTVTGAGGQHIGAFETSLALPPGQPTIGRDDETGALVVRWPAGGGAAGGAADETTVTIEGPTGPVCRTTNRTGLSIPDRLLPSMHPLVVVVERLHRAPLGAPGLPGGELEIVVRDTVMAASP